MLVKYIAKLIRQCVEKWILNFYSSHSSLLPLMNLKTRVLNDVLFCINEAITTSMTKVQKSSFEDFS
jgi:hypothetical protein